MSADPGSLIPRPTLDPTVRLRAASFRIAPAAPMPLRISIRSPVTGKELLVLTETPDGKLDVQGDEANWTEAAKQFIVGLTSVARQTRGY